ncbi:1-aminocyclopropane-1-carboxylate synthase [Stachybotrys elegans]|uniref:1-aminocyclopropane-1-carboxylate synthase n=1 Tax=Stachybotrys elegans TaxID=80388 RepID=A0A8K0WTB7_9HYPO|nr:1-aminocyclopropane-1-carboxylate synthase [Stachybotrys elegans]
MKLLPGLGPVLSIASLGVESVSASQLGQSSLVSERSQQLLSRLNVPWKFAPGSSARYNPEANPEGIVSFSTAENPLVHQELANFANQVELTPAAFTYGFAGSQRLLRAIAGHIEETFHPATHVNETNVQIFQGVTALHSVLAWALAEPGEGILVTRPVYGRLELDFGNENDVKVVYTDNEVHEAMELGIVENMERALLKSQEQGTKIKAVLIVNPSNPLGRYYPRETIVEIMKFCQRRRLHLISDEVYALTDFESLEGESENLPHFTSALAIDTDGLIDPNLVHVEYGTSKDFSAAGLRLGILITRNAELRRAAAALARFHEPSAPSVAITTAMFEDREWCRSFLEFSRATIATAYRAATSRLRELNIPYLEANSGFFVYIDLSNWLPPPNTTDHQTLGHRAREFMLAEKLQEGGVFLHPGEEGASEPGRFRMVYTQPERTMDVGLDR